MEVPCVNCKRNIRTIGDSELIKVHVATRGRLALCQACVRSLGLTVEPLDRMGTERVTHRNRVFLRPKGCNVFIGQVTLETARPTRPATAAPGDTVSLPFEPKRPGPGSKRVLVVDDAPDVLAVLSEALAAKGYAVHRAKGAEVALQLVAEHTFDLVVLDAVLPEHTGFVVLEGLRGMDRHRGTHTPVIMITGELRVEYRALAARLNVAGFLTKPFPLQNLLIRSEEVLCA